MIPSFIIFILIMLTLIFCIYAFIKSYSCRNIKVISNTSVNILMLCSFLNCWYIFSHQHRTITTQQIYTTTNTISNNIIKSYLNLPEKTIELDEVYEKPVKYKVTRYEKTKYFISWDEKNTIKIERVAE